MKKPYIYGHRGAMGYCIENTMAGFKKTIELKVGIETDVRLTKDNILVCFHDPEFKIGIQSYLIKDLTLAELKKIDFKDNREIATVEELFKVFGQECDTLRFSCDIGNRKAGLELIILAEKYSVLEKLEITEMKINILAFLRKQNDQIRLIHTIPHFIVNINNNTVDFDKLKELNIDTVNIKYEQANQKNFETIIENGFRCYTWGVNAKTRMKRVLNLNYNGKFVEGIYSDYPDKVKQLRDEIFKI
jgi:glycerophosphoryl diester phosphodiesterase